MTTPSVSPPGGQACYWDTPGGTFVDCVSWGTYAGPARDTGTPAPEIPQGQSLARKITPYCTTLLDELDDANNSSADFQLSAPSPRNNAATPRETPCGLEALKARVRRGRAIIRGEIAPPAPGDYVTLTLSVNRPWRPWAQDVLRLNA